MSTFEHRTKPCTCDNGYTYRTVSVAGEYFDADVVSEACELCDEHGTIDAACIECDTVMALNEELTCERCVDASTLTLAQFRLKYPERAQLDPRQRPDGRWSVAA